MCDLTRCGIPLYMCGSRLQKMYGYVPLVENTGLGIALMSYNGKLCWGFNADYDLVPDLRSFVDAIAESFEDLRKAAEALPANERSSLA